MMKFKKEQMKGITLISLVITIIILLILTGVILNMVLNDELIKQVKDAKKEINISNAREFADLIALEIVANEYNNDNVKELVREALIQNINKIQTSQDITISVRKYKIYITNLIGSTDEKTVIGEIQENGLLKWEASDIFAICKLGNSYYFDINDAIEDSKSEDVIEVIRDFTIDSGIEIKNSTPSSLIIDFKNHKLTSSTTAFFLKSGNKCALTVKNAEINNSSGYGAFNNTSSKLEDDAPSLILIDCIVTSKGEGTVWNNNGAHSMIMGGVYTNKGVLTENRNGLITIQDGKFIGDSISNRKNTKMTINGGDFTEVNVFVGMDGTLSENTVTIYGGKFKEDLSASVVEGYSVNENADGYFEVVPNS